LRVENIINEESIEDDRDIGNYENEGKYKNVNFIFGFIS
jgi:hypothetical protein